MADGKWIPGLTVETPVAEAARRVLVARLEVVARFLPLAAKAANDDIEYVHQVRVATRRTGAALRIFGACLPHKVRRKTKQQVRKIRRAAGEARDWDVFLVSLAEWAAKRPAADQPGLDFLRGTAFARRLDAQGHLHAVADEAPDIARISADIVAPHGHGSATLAELALPTLNQLFGELADATAADNIGFEQLHRIRILGKRLRYALEIFADCFAPVFRDELYPAIEEMQEILGAANDSHVAGLRLVDLRDRLKASRPAVWRRFQPGLEHLLQWHRRRLPQERRRFGRWLVRWNKKPVDLSDMLLTTAPAPALSEMA